MKHRLVTGAVVLGVVIFAVPGVWAFGWPRSFYDNVATNPPYNLHLVHNIPDRPHPQTRRAADPLRPRCPTASPQVTAPSWRQKAATPTSPTSIATS